MGNILSQWLFVAFVVLVIRKSEAKRNRTFSNPSSDIGAYLFQIGHNFFDRENCKEFFLQHYKEFAEIYNHRPDKVNLFGVRLNHAFAIHMIASQLKPQTIIESGVNAGQSTYFFRRAAPFAKIISLDPLAESNVNQSPRWVDTTNNDYLTGSTFQDITKVDWAHYEGVEMNTTLVFIDDHQQTFPRMQHLHKLGFTHFVIEDNNPLGYGAFVHERGHSPKTVLLGRQGSQEKAKWLKDHLETYHEIPPLFYGGNTLSDRGKKKNMLGHHLLQGNFSFLPVYAHPLFRTDLSAVDLRVALEFRDLLGFSFENDYDDFMCYNHITYLKMKKYVSS